MICKISGISKTIQRGDMFDFGTHFMVAPMTNEVVINQKTCFVLNGTKDQPAAPQSILPDVSTFKVYSHSFLLTLLLYLLRFPFLQCLQGHGHYYKRHYLCFILIDL